MFCQLTTNNHARSVDFPSIMIDLDALVTAEGCNVNPSPFQDRNLMVIDGDKLEEEFARCNGNLNKAKSVDLIFGMQNGSFQFVEFKFRSTSFRFLNKSDIVGKIQGSQTALGNSAPINNNRYYLVFRTEILFVARRYLFRQAPILNSVYKAVDIAHINENYFK